MVMFSFKARTQIHHEQWQHNDSASVGISLVSDIMYQTTGIENQLTDKFIFGGFIDNDIKESSLNKLNDRNNFIGAKIVNGMTIYLPQLKWFKNDRWSHFLGIYNQHTLTGHMTSDLFELAFYGADPDETRNYEIKNAGLEFISSNKLSWGLYDKKYGSNFSVAVHQAYNWLEAQAGSEADLFYSDQAILLQADGRLRNSNPLQNGIGALNGWGITTDLNWVIPVQWNAEKEEQLFKISVLNFGGYFWSNYTQTTALDTIIEYSGYTLENSFNFPSFPDNLEDTISFSSEQGHRMSWAPAVISVQKIIDPSSTKKWQAFYGLSMWSTKWNLPLIHAGVDYKWTDGLHTSAHLSYGGFGRMRGGLMLDYKINENYHFWVGSQNVLGWISNNATGRSINGGIRLWL